MSFLPSRVHAVAHFLWRLPVYWRGHQSRRKVWSAGAPHGTIYLGCEPTRALTLPNNRVAASVFTDMTFEAAGASELLDFLSLAEGHSTFVDAGASGGYFSTVFSLTRTAPHHVLSIEFDSDSLAVLEEMRELNSNPDGKWIIDSRGISDKSEKLFIEKSGYGAKVSNVGHQGDALVVMDTLENICNTHAVAPDFLKMDIEGYEYEAVLGSIGFLRRCKPTLWLELHFQLMEERGKDASQLIEALDSLGYREFRSKRKLRDLFPRPSGWHHVGLCCK